MSRRARLVAVALVGALLGVTPAPAGAVPAALGLDVTSPAFAGEQLLAQSEAMPTPGGRDSWTCHVDFGDGSTGGFWRAQPYDPVAPCAGFHTYAVPGAYTVTMTVTDAEGGTVTEQRQVTVGSRQVTTKAAGVEGTRVLLTGADAGTHWSFAGAGPDVVPCELGRQPAASITVRCHRDGTYRVLFDGDSAATSGAYDVTWTNGAPRPTMRATRTLLRRNGNPYEVPVRRIGTGDQVRFDVRANDPSTHGTQGDPLRCTFRHGNGLREVQDAYLPRGSCNGQTSYLAPGRHTSRVRVTDDDRAAGTARTTVVVVRRDVRLAVRDLRRGGTDGVLGATLTPRGLRGRVSLRFPNGRTLVATRLTSIQVTAFGALTLLGRAEVDGRPGYRFAAFPDTRYPQGIAFSLQAWPVGKPRSLVLNLTVSRRDFRVRLHAPPVG